MTQNDLQNVKNSLHLQLQAEIKTWLQGLVSQGDIAGKPFPDVAGSAQPLSQEQLTQVPTAGSPFPSKTFSGTLSVKVSLLVVRRSNLIAAAQSQLNAGSAGNTTQSLRTFDAISHHSERCVQLPFKRWHDHHYYPFGQWAGDVTGGYASAQLVPYRENGRPGV